MEHMPPPARRMRAATSAAPLHARSALQLAEARSYRELLHALQLRPELAQARDELAMLPLHWVCTDRDAPLRVLQQVVLAFPQATTARNLAGMLPLHLAVRKDLPLDALKTLLKFYPKAVVAEAPDGSTPVDMAKTHVSSRSARVFLHMLEQEVRAMARVPASQHSHAGSVESSNTIAQSTVSSARARGHPDSDGWSKEAQPSETAGFARDPALPPEWKLSKSCHVCDIKFGYFKNRHHCRNCGESVCGRHSKRFVPLRHLGLFHPQRVCSDCSSHLQTHYSARAIARLSPLSVDRLRADVVYEDTLPAQYAYSPPRRQQQQQQLQRATRSRSVVNMPSHHPLLSPRHNLLSTPTPPTPPHSALRSPALTSRSSRSATLSPRSCRTGSSSARSDASSAATVRSGNQPNVVKMASGVSMHLTHLQRTDNQGTVQERQQDMQRRRERLAQTDLDAYSSREWSESVNSSNQSSNDDHELKLEMQMEKLVQAKRKISAALGASKRTAERAKQKKDKYDEIAKKYEDHGYSCSSLSEGDVAEDSILTNDSDSEVEDTSSFASEAMASVGPCEDNQQDHEMQQNPDEVDGVYAMVPETTPGQVKPPIAVTSPFEKDRLEVPLDRAATHRDLGLVFLTKCDYDNAVVELRKAVDLDPTSAAAWYHLAKSLDGKGEREEAEVAINRSLAIDDNSLPGLSLLGKLLNARGEHDEAIIVFRRALSLQCPRNDAVRV